MRYRLTAALMLFILITACNTEQDPEFVYEGEVKEDTLFLGYYFGMPLQEFFDYSFELNAKGIITNGSGAEIVKKENRLKADARMSFYPEFKDGRIYMMPVVYSYLGWAPWNTHLSSDSLLTDLISHYQDSLNITFKRFEQDTMPEVYYLNRMHNKEIRMHTMSGSKVLVNFTDLSQVEK